MRFRNFYNKNIELLFEGGGAGHMKNVFDADGFSFNELKTVIKKALAGDLGFTTVKLDGANLMVSWIDGRLRAARNTGHLKNFGETSLNAEEVKQKFSGRGMLQKAFAESMNDLETAIGTLSEKQRQKIFQNGKKWMSFELIHPGVENVVPYNVVQINFHGTREVDEDGNTMSENKADAKLLENMLKQRQQEKQKTYNIRSVEPVTLKRIKDYGKHKKEVTAKLNAVMKKNKLKGSDTIHDMKVKHFKKLVESKLTGKYDDNIISKLIQRFAFYDKSYRAPDIKKDLNPKDYKWAMAFDKKSGRTFKNMILPLEKVFLDLGVRVLQGLSDVMGVNPAEATQKMKKNLEKVIKLAKGSDDPKVRDKIALELDRLGAIGGMDAVLPTEGIVFFHKGEMLKLTGAFAPVNQIMGLRFRFE